MSDDWSNIPVARQGGPPVSVSPGGGGVIIQWGPSEIDSLRADNARLRSVMGSVRRYIVTHGRIQGSAGGHKEAILSKIDAALAP